MDGKLPQYWEGWGEEIAELSSNIRVIWLGVWTIETQQSYTVIPNLMGHFHMPWFLTSVYFQFLTHWTTQN